MAKANKSVDLGSLQDDFNDSVSFHKKCKKLLASAQAVLDKAQDNYNKAEVQYNKAREALLAASKSVVNHSN